MIEFTSRSFGANLLASDINLEIGGNLLLKSRQNLLESDYYSVGASLGISSNSGKRIDGVNGGFNTADGYQSRAWVDQVSSIENPGTVY